MTENMIQAMMDASKREKEMEICPLIVVTFGRNFFLKLCISFRLFQHMFSITEKPREM